MIMSASPIDHEIGPYHFRLFLFNVARKFSYHSTTSLIFSTFVVDLIFVEDSKVFLTLKKNDFHVKFEQILDSILNFILFNLSIPN